MDFTRALDGKSCVATMSPPPRADFGPWQKQECAASGFYKVDMYRKVAGDRCALAARIKLRKCSVLNGEAPKALLRVLS